MRRDYPDVRHDGRPRPVVGESARRPVISIDPLVLVRFGQSGEIEADLLRRGWNAIAWSDAPLSDIELRGLAALVNDGTSDNPPTVPPGGVCVQRDELRDIGETDLGLAHYLEDKGHL